MSIYNGTRGPITAPILVVGEAFGENERQKNQPFVGASGILLEEMLREAGLDPTNMLFANCIAKKPYGNDMVNFLIPTKGSGGKWLNGVNTSPELEHGLWTLDQIIREVQPVLIISCGNWPTWWLTGRLNVATKKGYKIPQGIDTWRGSQVYTTSSCFNRPAGIPVLPILHPASILRMYKNKVVCVQDLRKVKRLLSGLYFWDDKTPRGFNIQPTADEVCDYIDEIRLSPECPIVNDLETYKERIHIIGLSENKHSGITIPFFHIKNTGELIPYFNKEDNDRVYWKLYDLFNDPNMSFIGQNYQYDLQYINEYFFNMPRVHWDTMVAQHTMFPRLRKSLDFMASMYCDHYIYWKEDRKESLKNEDLIQGCAYNAEDLWRTWEVCNSQKTAMAQMGCQAAFDKRMKLMRAALHMSNRGLNIDNNLRQEQKMELFHYAEQLITWLDAVIPSFMHPQVKSDIPWYRSPQQRAMLLYDILKLKEMRSKTGGRTTDKEALAELGYKYPHLTPIFSALIVLNSIGVIAGNFLSAKRDPDKRMRSSFSVAGPITNRLNSYESSFGSGTNFQNLMRPRGPMDMLDQDLV